MAVDLDGGGADVTDPVDSYLTMTDRTGRRFRCALPANGTAGSDTGTRADNAGQVRLKRLYSQGLSTLWHCCGFFRSRSVDSDVWLVYIGEQRLNPGLLQLV